MALAEELVSDRSILPGFSDSTLSTLEGSGLEELAAFIRKSSGKVQLDRRQHQHSRANQNEGEYQHEEQQQLPQQPPQQKVIHAASDRRHETHRFLQDLPIQQLQRDHSGSSREHPHLSTEAKLREGAQFCGRNSSSRKPSPLPEVESPAEMIVLSATASALQHSKSMKNNGIVGASNAPTNSHSVEVNAKATPAQPETRPPPMEPVPMSQTESLAEMMVLSATESAIQHSTRMTSYGTTGALDGQTSGHSVKMQAKATPAQLGKQPANTEPVAMSQTESVAEMMVLSATESALQFSTRMTSYGMTDALNVPARDYSVEVKANDTLAGRAKQPAPAGLIPVPQTESVTEIMVLSATESDLQLANSTTNNGGTDALDDTIRGRSAEVEANKTPALLGKVPIPVKLSIMSPTESLAQMMLSGTESDLQLANSTANNGGTDALDDTIRGRSAEVEANKTPALLGKVPIPVKLSIMSPTESLAQMMMLSGTESDLQPSHTRSSNGMNRASDGQSSGHSAAIEAKASPTRPEKQPALTGSFPISPTESVAEMMVLSATGSALQLSGSKTGSSNGPARSVDMKANEVQARLGMHRTPAGASPMSLTESVAEMMALSATESALQRSSSRVSHGMTGDPSSGVEPMASPPGCTEQSTTERPFSMSEAEPLAQMVELPATEAGFRGSNSRAGDVSTGARNLPNARGAEALTAPEKSPGHEKWPAAVRPYPASQTESLAELVVLSATESALYRSSSGTRNVAMGARCHPDDGRAVAAETASTTKIPGKRTTTRDSFSACRTEPLAELVAPTATHSALQRSSNSILPDVGIVNGIVLENSLSRTVAEDAGENNFEPNDDGKKKRATRGAARTTVTAAYDRGTLVKAVLTPATNAQALREEGTTALEVKGERARNTIVPRDLESDLRVGETSGHGNFNTENDAGRVLLTVERSGRQGRSSAQIAPASSNVRERGGGDDSIGNNSVLSRAAENMIGGSNLHHQDHEYLEDKFEDSVSEKTGSCSTDFKDGYRARPLVPEKQGMEIFSAILAARFLPSAFRRQTSVEMKLRKQPFKQDGIKRYSSAPLPAFHGLQEHDDDCVVICEPEGRAKVAVVGSKSKPSVQMLPPSTDRLKGQATISEALGDMKALRPTVSPSDAAASASPCDGSVSRTTSMPAGENLGLAGLHQGVMAWFSDEVLPGSTATAVDFLSKEGRETSPNGPLVAIPLFDAGTTNSDGDAGTSLSNDRVDDSAPAKNQKGISEGDAEVSRAPCPDDQRRKIHPARLFHLLWQRNRFRCPFSTPIPETVCFDSTGTAVDWFFTSTQDGGIKRKLSSNTRLSNIFWEFSKGIGAERDPVAVLISWRQDESDHTALPATSACWGAASAGPPPAAETKAEHERRWERQPHKVGITHMTAQDLLTFLFGSNRDFRSYPKEASGDSTSAPVARGGKRRRTGSLDGNGRLEQEDAALRPGLRPTPHRCTHGGGALAAHDACPRRHVELCRDHFTERSDAAAKAAGKGGQGDDGGGWCLLQKYIGPSGSRNSTLRCHWTPPAAADANFESKQPHFSSCCAEESAAATTIVRAERSHYRWGSVEEIEASFRERSPDRSPFRHRPECNGSVQLEASRRRPPSSQWPARETAGLELGAAERVSRSEGVHAGCLLERSTNIHRADRRELSCEDRCVTFEELSPSRRGGVWPRSVNEPIRSAALRETLVETCNTVSDHIFQVTRGAFRPKGATGYFRQGRDGRTYLLFFSHWSQNPAVGLAPCEPPLARAMDMDTTAESRARVLGLDGEHRAGRKQQGKSPSVLSGTVEDRRLAAGAIPGDGQEENFLPHSWPSTSGLVCPGCGCSSVRGGVRCEGEDSGIDRGEPHLGDPQRAKSKLRGAQLGEQATTIQLVAPNRRKESTCYGSVEDFVGRGGMNSGESPTQSLPADITAPYTPAAPAASGGTFYTTLGVIVDTCTWWRREVTSLVGATEGGRTAENEESVTGKGRTAVSAGAARCLRLLGRIHPGVSPESLSQRCTEDLRLRLKDVRVCRGCALEIADASDQRLRKLGDVARTKASELADLLGLIAGAKPPPERERKARVLADIKAFRQRLTSASASSASPGRAGPSRNLDAFGGRPSRMGDDSSPRPHGRFPSRPRGKKGEDRPRTTDGMAQRQQAFKHSARKVVSATTPSSGDISKNEAAGYGRTAVAPRTGGGDDPTITAAMGSPQDDRDRGAGSGQGSVRDSLRTVPKVGDTTGVAERGGAFGDGLACSAANVKAASGNQIVDGSPRANGSWGVPAHDTKDQLQQLHHSREETVARETVPSVRSFHDPSEIALRNRRVFDAYSRNDCCVPGGFDEFFPKPAGSIRPTKSAAAARGECGQQQRKKPLGTTFRTFNRVSRSAGKAHPPAKRQSSNSSKALQWAKTVSAKAIKGGRSAHGPRPSSSPRGQGGGLTSSMECPGKGENKSGCTRAESELCKMEADFDVVGCTAASIGSTESVRAGGLDLRGTGRSSDNTGGQVESTGGGGGGGGGGLVSSGSLLDPVKYAGVDGLHSVVEDVSGKNDVAEDYGDSDNDFDPDSDNEGRSEVKGSPNDQGGHGNDFLEGGSRSHRAEITGDDAVDLIPSMLAETGQWTD